MVSRRLACLLLGASLWTSSVAAQEQVQGIVEVTHERALALARRQAPELVVARARAREVRSQVEAASVWPFNPQVSGVAGPRFRNAGTIAQWQVGVQQWLELGGQGGDRVDAARAGAAAEQERSMDAQRLLLREVSLAFIAALYWERRVAIAGEGLRIAEATARVATRRHEVGDIGGLSRTVSRLAVVRARTAADQVRASQAQVEGRLKGLLGVPAEVDLVCRGDLRELGFVDLPPTDVGDRPDMRALLSDRRQARAEAQLGRASRAPRVAVGARYSREESDDIVQGSLTVALPVFDHGQGATAVAMARSERVRTELEATRRIASVEVHTARTTANHLLLAVRRFEEQGLEPLERSERIATVSHQAGAIPLGELLAVRRELAQAKLEYAELLLGAATARAELAAATGALQ